MGRSGLLHRLGHADVVVSPMDCVGPMAFSRLLTCKDNVHPNGEFLMILALTIWSIRKLHQCGNLPGAKGLLPPGLTYSLFSGQEQSRRLAGGLIPDDQFKPVTIHAANLSPIPFV